jgi:hypothetical protein
MDARYQAPAFGTFLSEDPNFINAGAPDWVTRAKGDPRATTGGARLPLLEKPKRRIMDSPGFGESRFRAGQVKERGSNATHRAGAAKVQDCL